MSLLIAIAFLGPVAAAPVSDKGAPTPRSAEAPLAARVLDDKELAAMWKDLARDDDEGARTVYRHIRAMIQSPTSSVAFLKKHLKPVAAPDPKQMGQWIDELDSGDFNTREKATRELGRIGALAASALKKKLEGQLPSLEARRRAERLLEKLEAQTYSPEELRMRRSVEVLFGAATVDARALLEELSRGAPGAPLTEDARGSLAALAALGTPARR